MPVPVPGLHSLRLAGKGIPGSTVSVVAFKPGLFYRRDRGLSIPAEKTEEFLYKCLFLSAGFARVPVILTVSGTESVRNAAGQI